ncbi:MAG TPA: FmdB family zinc ribbon protein [Dehalococcoidia bacterium]|nr:FmdB family zinc ribbon protein [Dehalococcoidia bacterium]
MPTYVYRCEGGHQYERRESFSAPAEHDCDDCGRQARRIPVPTAVIFKGGGWYKTDSRSSNGSSSAESSSSESTPAKSEKAESSTDSSEASTSSTTSSETKKHGHSHGPGTHTH